MECTCKICKDMCKRPCWPTPEGAERLINAGYSNRLMLDYWTGDNYIYIVSPALKGSEGNEAPFWPTGRCNFQNKKGLCELHNKNLKPLEGKLASCKNNIRYLHKYIAKLWDTEKGRTVVRLWKKNIKMKG